jgi:PKD repeat protein/alpha-tubulin suppressor-like RCC1 family protein
MAVKAVRSCCLLLLVFLLAATGCKLNLSHDPGEMLPAFKQSISDAEHGDGRANFYFLPPLVHDPAPGGVFDPSLSPRVVICEHDGTSCLKPPLAEFSMESGKGSERLRICPDEEHYLVNWHTGDYQLNEAKTYRIRVFLDVIELGYCDVDVVNSGRDLKTVDCEEYVPLKEGRTLPIKFRLEEGVCVPPRADFTALTPTSGPVPHTVRFEDISSGDIGLYEWDFDGDGVGDLSYGPEEPQPIPEWTYEQPGLFSVGLTVSGPCGSDALVREEYVEAFNNRAPLACFSPEEGAVLPLTVSFDAGCTQDPDGDPLTYSWDFGDGTTLENQAGPLTVHTYGDNGFFTVTLTAADDRGGVGTAAAEVSVGSNIAAWGWNNYGQCNVPEGNRYQAVAAGLYHSLALDDAGFITAWGSNNRWECANLPGGSERLNSNTWRSTTGGFLAVAAGEGFGAAVDGEGHLVVWGVPYDGRIYAYLPGGYTVTSAAEVTRIYSYYRSQYSGFTALAAGVRHLLALDAEGRVWVWGVDVAASVRQVPYGVLEAGQYAWHSGPGGFTAVAGSYAHSIALKGGHVYTWGSYLPSNYTPGGVTQIGPACFISTAEDFTAVAAGLDHNLALKTDGKIYIWGSGSNAYLAAVPGGYVGVGAYAWVSITGDFAAVAAGWQSHAAIKPAGFLVSWGYPIGGYTAPAGSDFISVNAGRLHCLGLEAVP